MILNNLEPLLQEIHCSQLINNLEHTHAVFVPLSSELHFYYTRLPLSGQSSSHI